MGSKFFLRCRMPFLTFAQTHDSYPLRDPSFCVAIVDRRLELRTKGPLEQAEALAHWMFRNLDSQRLHNLSPRGA